jgi:hypothetical protein
MLTNPASSTAATANGATIDRYRSVSRMARSPLGVISGRIGWCTRGIAVRQLTHAIIDVICGRQFAAELP